MNETKVVMDASAFDEIRVYDGIAERTGTQLGRAGVRGRPTLCRSITDLASKCRRLGDGYYYLAAKAWPEGEVSVTLNRPWESLG
jgi:hypothetical protein